MSEIETFHNQRLWLQKKCKDTVHKPKVFKNTQQYVRGKNTTKFSPNTIF